MAGTRGIAMLRGRQLNNQIMRDRHFDAEHKINEKFIDIDFSAHREILENTKIDVFSQVNNKVIAGLNQLDITEVLVGKKVATAETEGVVTGERVDIRVSGTEDFPFIDSDGDRVYGRIEFEASPDGGVTSDAFKLNFFSIEDGVETRYTFADDAPNMDFRYILRTNMSVIPVDSIIKGGAGFVEGATDANAYMNLIQLMKDIYGNTGTLDNDGNANLTTSLVEQIADEINARTQADQDLLDNFASQAEQKGANLVGVEVDSNGNYVGTTVQEVLTELANKLTEFYGHFDSKLTELDNECEEEVFESVGGENKYLLQNGKAKPKSVMLALNGQIQAPGINYEYLKDNEGNIIGFNFAPDVLEVIDGVPDVLFVQYRKVQ